MNDTINAMIEFYTLNPILIIFNLFMLILIIILPFTFTPKNNVKKISYIIALGAYLYSTYLSIIMPSSEISDVSYVEISQMKACNSENFNFNNNISKFYSDNKITSLEYLKIRNGNNTCLEETKPNKAEIENLKVIKAKEKLSNIVNSI